MNYINFNNIIMKDLDIHNNKYNKVINKKNIRLTNHNNNKYNKYNHYHNINKMKEK